MLQVYIGYPLAVLVVKDWHSFCVKIILLYGILKINQYYISSASLVLQKQPGELISEGELIFYKPPGIGSPLALNGFSSVMIKMLFSFFYYKR